MSAEQFRAFVAYAKTAFGWSKLELARRLGCDKNRIKAWEADGCPRYIALACSALACRLPPLFMP